MFRIACTKDYSDWFNKQSDKVQGLISARLERILEHGHFGDAKHLDNKLSELRWRNGLRIRFAIIHESEEQIILLLVGGNKNSQNKDIRKSKKLIEDLEG